MDAIKLLTSDHDEVRGLFDQFRTAKEANDSDRMHELQRRIFDELAPTPGSRRTSSTRP